MNFRNEYIPRRLINRFRRSRQERVGVLFVLVAVVLFWTMVVGLDIVVHTINSVTVIHR